MVVSTAVRGIFVHLGHDWSVNIDYALISQSIAAAEESSDGPDSVSIALSICALSISALVAILNWLSIERRHRSDTVRTALIDLTSGSVATARNETTIFLGDPVGRESELFRARYFELCWAYQRGDSARKASGKVIKGHGIEDLNFHLKSMAELVHAFHAAKETAKEEDIPSFVDDSHIWNTISESIIKDATGNNIEVSDKLEDYFRMVNKTYRN